MVVRKEKGDDMQFQVFSVPAGGSPEATAVLNQFLRGHRVMSVERQLIADGTASCWSFCIEYLESPMFETKQIGKVDYKEILPPPQFEVFSRLRNLRKELADKEAVPPYAIFSNEQLARMAQLEKPSLQAMELIEGIGQSRISKYGAAFLAVLRGTESKSEHEASGTTDGADNRA